MKIAFYLLLLLPVSLFAQGGLPTQPYIYVEGKADAEKPADMAILRFDIVSRQADEKKANADVQAKANAVLAVAKSRSISDDDVIAQSLHSEPELESSENSQKKGKIVGYAVSRPFSVKVRDVASFPKLADELMAIGGVEFSAIDGGLQKEEEVEQGLWTKALANAREQAERTVNSMGMKIESVYAISPEPISQITSAMFPKDSNGKERVVVTGSYIPTPEETGSKPSQYHLAPISVTQTVHVIYLISSAK